jgi:NAD(P)H-flavin reductase
MKATISHIEYSHSKEVTFVRCQPEEIFTFKEGQFMMISSDFNHKELGKPLKKPYSIATTHQELQEK